MKELRLYRRFLFLFLDWEMSDYLINNLRFLMILIIVFIWRNKI